MNWKQLLCVPLAALCVGQSARPSLLKPAIPGFVNDDCAYDIARKNYLLAYARAKNNAELSNFFCRNAVAGVSRCGIEAAILRERIKILCDL